MFFSSYLAEEVAARTTTFNSLKDYEVSEPTLIDNVCVIGYNKFSNFAKSNTFFERYGGYPANNRVNGGVENMNFAVLLKTEYDESSGNYLIGANTSNDPDQSNHSATIQLDFSSSTSVGGTEPIVYPGQVTSFYTRIINAAPDYFLDLKSLAGNNRFCRIRVMPDPNQANYSLIEGHVYIHVVTTSNQTGQVKKPQVIFGQEQNGQSSPENGWPSANVINKDILIDLKTEAKAYLWAMVTYSKPDANDPNHFKFEVGDPRDNAEIEVHEV